MKKRNVYIGNILKLENSKLIKEKESKIFIKKYDYFINLDDIANGLDLVIEDYNYICHKMHALPTYQDAINEEITKGVQITGKYFSREEAEEKISISKLKKKVLLDSRFKK